jgi:hypothetical protein
LRLSFLYRFFPVIMHFVRLICKAYKIA